MFALGLLIALLLAACGPANTPEPSATPTSTASQAVILAPTLPPEWTPTDTLTPLPPTAARTATPTPSLTPTLDAAGMCAAFELLLQPRQAALSSAGSLSLIWNYPLADAAVVLRITYQSGASLEMTIPGPNSAVVQLDFASLHGAGAYDWTLTPLTPDEEPLTDCAISGHVLAVWPWSEFLPWAQF